MSSQELKERLNKALENVEKRKATIEKHKAQAEKKLQKITENGLSLKLEDYRGTTDMEAYWLVVEYYHKLDDIKEATNKLQDAEQIVANWRAKLDKQIALEITLAERVPEAFKQARAELVEEWVAYDIAQREKMLKARKELPHKEFRKLYKYLQEQDLSHTDEEFRKIEEREADLWLINLYNRVKAVTGEVTDCSNIHWGGKCLDGFIVGVKGKARVETIGAGGYNIQCYHLRVLVHKYEERG